MRCTKVNTLSLFNLMTYIYAYMHTVLFNPQRTARIRACSHGHLSQILRHSSITVLLDNTIFKLSLAMLYTRLHVGE